MQNNNVEGNGIENKSMKNELPEGLGFSMALNLEAMKNFSGMSKREQEEVIRKSKSVKTKEEMEHLVNQIAGGERFFG